MGEIGDVPRPVIDKPTPGPPPWWHSVDLVWWIGVVIAWILGIAVLTCAYQMYRGRGIVMKQYIVQQNPHNDQDVQLGNFPQLNREMRVYNQFQTLGGHGKTY